jgi:uncharacterized membrane protein (DUF4010 family)
MTRLADGGAAAYAGTAILVAVAANSLSKSALAIFAGGVRFGLAYLALTVLALAAGAAVATVLVWT